MTLKTNFPIFPHPQKKNESYFFNNGFFENSNNKYDKLKILEFSKNMEGWTDELTEMAHDHIDANHPIDVASREMCVKFLDKYDKSENKIVLEIGCSSGNLIAAIKEKKNFNYIGSDAVRNQIIKLTSLHNDTPFLIFDLLKNPLKKNFCNSLIMLNVLEHIKNDDEALLEANKILDKEGILIIEVPSGKFLYDDYDRNLLHFRRYNMKEIIKKIENAGFKIEKKTHLGFLIFPIFVLVKIFNKFFKNKNIVIKQAKMSNNLFLKMMFGLEKKLLNIYLPFGIRCYICARKK